MHVLHCLSFTLDWIQEGDYVFLLVGIRVLFVIGVQAVNPLAQLWGPGSDSETMKQLNSLPRRSPKIGFGFRP